MCLIFGKILSGNGIKLLKKSVHINIKKLIALNFFLKSLPLNASLFERTCLDTVPMADRGQPRAPIGSEKD